LSNNSVSATASLAAPAKAVAGWGSVRAKRALLFGVPALALLALDVSLRSAQLARLPIVILGSYAGTVLLSAALWASLLAVASRREGGARWVARTAMLAAAALGIGGQIYVFEHYESYLNDQAVVMGASLLPSIGQLLWSDRLSFARAVLPPALLALALPIVVARVAPVRERYAAIASDLALALLLVVMFLASPSRKGEHAATPDVLYLSAMGQLSQARWNHEGGVDVLPGARMPIALPPLVAKPPRPRNVLMVVTESVRAESTCVAYDPSCAWTPFSNEAAPRRLPLTQMRSVDSTTAISIAVMWSGLPPTASREALHSAPLLWEYAHAAGIDTAYWTSQNLMFANSGTYLDGVPLTSTTSATQLDPEAPLLTGADDSKLVTHVLESLPALREPYAAVVQLSNTHFPYEVDPSDTPWQPQAYDTTPGHEIELANRYRNSIYSQDKAIARLIREVRARPEGARTVIVFISDHGDQLREKGFVGHSGMLYDTEIHVPAWIDAPPGALTAEEESQLRALAKAPLTTLDMMPTLLDLLGVWDAAAIAPMRAKMPGQSLLRGGTKPTESVVITNCTEIWACGVRSWGAMRGSRKLIATQGSSGWKCFDTLDDPTESFPMDIAACGDLQAVAEEGRGTPF
jgi:glucan phosphoethanolaminetransferase (alkaline phosphatase superfamily)